MVTETPIPKDKAVETLKKILLAARDLDVFAVLDEDLETAVPYLAQLEEDSLFTDWLLCEGWDHHWGIFATATTLKTMHKHFGIFLMAKDTKKERTTVSAYYCESDKDGLVALRQRDGELKQSKIFVKATI